jgi:putative ABC transport system permease protein
MRLYAAILLLYPASFRAEYGREMRAIFANRWRKAPAQRRPLLLFDALIDALRNAPPLHGEILRQDAASAARTLRCAPGFSLAVILVTAIGIGATTAAFAVADHVLIRPLPFSEPHRLVNIWRFSTGGRVQASPADFRDWRDQARSLEHIGTAGPSTANLVGRGEPLRLEGARVSGQLFTVLGVRPLLGRTITEDDDRSGGPNNVVISERLWRVRFGADPASLGTSVLLNDTPHTIVGVMPESFHFPSRRADYWIALQFRPFHYVYGNPYLHTVARLKPGVSIDQAMADVQAITREAARRDPQANPRLSAIVNPMRDEVSPQSRLLLLGLVAAAACLMLIAWTNLANLMLTRGLARQKEMAVRSALGAGRHRLVRQMFTESVLLGGTGGAAGIAFAMAAIPSIVRLVPSALPIAEMPSVDIRFLLGVIAGTFLTAVAFGLLPALRLARYSDARALQDGARAGTSRRTTRMRSSLVVAQVGASVVLLVSCGLLMRAMLEIQARDPGFTADGLIMLRTTLSSPRYTTVAGRHAFYDRVIEDVKAIPGVSHAAYVTGAPMAAQVGSWYLRGADLEHVDPEQRLASLRYVTPGFFAALDIPLRAGRDVDARDREATPPVAIVSESFVRRFWPGEDAIGRQFTLRNRDWRIVGIVGDVRTRGLEREGEPQMYLPSRQVEDGGVIGYAPKDLVVRSTLAPEALVPLIRTIVARADPQQPISDVQTLEEVVAADTAPRTVQVRVLGSFAVIAVLLAGIGLHGLLAYNVSRSAREIGVRIALGAQRRGILVMVMRHGLRLAAAGVLIGAVVALAAGRSLQSLLAGISPTDATAFAAAIGMAMLVAIAGSLIPALRAIRVDPIEVMRAE